MYHEMENHFFLLIFTVQTDAVLLFFHSLSFCKLSMSTLCEVRCLWLMQRDTGERVAGETGIGLRS